jgi:hypothetical protein
MGSHSDQSSVVGCSLITLGPTWVSDIEVTEATEALYGIFSELQCWEL